MNYKLDKEEKEILRAFEKGEMVRIENMEEEIKRYREIAKHSLAKDSRINIRLTSRDLELLKRKAVIEGIPYQTLISSILHKYVNGTL